MILDDDDGQRIQASDSAQCEMFPAVRQLLNSESAARRGDFVYRNPKTDLKWGCGKYV